MRIFVIASILVISLAGCLQKQPTEQLLGIAYEWEKAYMDSDYERQQQLVYKKGSFTVDKDSIKEESGLKKDNVTIEIYHDNESDKYYALTDYINPQEGNRVQSVWALREKKDSWKVDTKASRDITKEQVLKYDCLTCNKEGEK